MNRSVTWLGVLLACALGVAACSSSSKPATGGTQGGTTIATVAPPPPPQPLSVAVQACTLASSAEVQSLLGTAAVGIEADHSSAYRTCNWSKTGSVAGVGDTFSLAVLRLGGDQIGFTHTRVAGFDAKVIKGLGDAATYSTGRNSRGFAETILFADEGNFSVALGLTSAAASPDPAALQVQMVSAARAAFTKLGAHPSTTSSTVAPSTTTSGP